MHETLCRAVEYLGTVDQMNMPDSVSTEFLFRKLQLIEHYYDERDASSVDNNTKQPIEEVRAFVGGARPTSMVCPALLDHVSKELEKISAIKKNHRKLREEQAAIRAAAKSKGGKGAKDDPS